MADYTKFNGEEVESGGDGARRPGLGDVLAKFWPIGILSFGGTQANMAMFHQMIVTDLQWVEAQQYAELLGIVQALPGASAAQILLASVTAATGRPFAGILAFLLFCVPGAVGMAALGTHIAGVDIVAIPYVAAAQMGIGCAATVLVAQGAWELGQKLVVDKLTKGLWLVSCLVCFASAASPALLSVLTLVILAGGALVALYYYPPCEAKAGGSVIADVGIGRFVGKLLMAIVWLVLLVLVLAPLLMSCPAWVSIASLYYMVGCLVFGGGPVVIPLLLLQLIAEKALTPHQFILGFSAVQAFPGPMFNLAAFCGALQGGWRGALLAWTAMMAPGTFLAFGALPFWAELRSSSRVQRALKGVNACAAGLMGSAVLLLWETIVATRTGLVCLTVGLLGLTQIFKIKPYCVILVSMVVGLGAWAAEQAF
mmetsp:Transcript_25364/g.70560  ORF Transcript_25364/g.70560 Transcript_25364/m.70560 type:complete len:426 (-) Transcript_25364:76-1353(-)